MAATLVASIQSAIDQSYENWEMIIIDNCSEDHLETVIEKYSSDKRIRFLSIDEKDRSKARNHGIRESAGDYITFLDADDSLHPDYLKTFVEILQKFPEVIAISDLTVIKGAKSYELKKSGYSHLPKFEYALNYGHISIAVPSRAFNKYNFEGQLGEDRYLMARMSEEFDFIFTSKPYYIYNDDYVFATKEELKKRFDSDNESLMLFYDEIKKSDPGEYSLLKAQYDLAIRNFYAAKFYSFDKLASEILFSRLMKPYSFLTFIKTVKALIYYYTVHFKKSDTSNVRRKI